MGKKKKSAVARAVAAPVAVSISPPSAAPVPEIQKSSKSPYIAPVYLYTPSRKERRDYAHTKLKGEPLLVKEPIWVKTRKANHERRNSQSNSVTYSVSTPGRKLSPTVRPFTPRTHIEPPPKLQPLFWVKPQTPPLDSTDQAASHALWWAHISNSLASLSARSYHLFVASNFLTCKTEELLLLYEVRKLNADGKLVFEEVVRGLRERQLDWKFMGDCEGIDELRISWDMTAKEEMVGRLEREIRGDAGRWFEDDEKTVVDGHTRHALHGDCAIEDSTSEDSPTDYSGPVGKCEINAPSEKGELDAVIRATVGDGCAVENSPSDEAPSNASVLNWADEINDSCQDDCKIPVDSRKGQEDSAISDSSVEETLTDVSVSTPVATSPRI